MTASTLIAVAAHDAHDAVTDIAVFEDRALVARFRVFSEWATDWNAALHVRGFEVSAPWPTGAPLWVTTSPAGTREYTNTSVGRCAALL
jgi:hypothetical protein